MTISTTTTKVSLSGNGSTHSFAFNFKIFADADLTVIIRSATGTETTKTLDTHYIITGTGAAGGGNVLFKYNTGDSGDAHYSTSDYRPANGETAIIKRVLTLTQATDYVENDPFSSIDHENALDRLTMADQQQQEQLARAFQFPVTYTGAASTTVPEPVASKVLQWNAAANAFENGPTSAAISAAETNATNAASSASTASGHASTASTQATLATNYAVKVDGVAAGSDHSSKAWAVGGTGITDTSSKGASREWAIETSGTVDGTSFSSKEYALGVQGSNGGSAKQWALGGGGSYTISTAVSGGLYSAKYHAAAAEASAQAANSGQLYSEVVNKAVSFTVDNDDDGKYFIVDTSGGDRTVTLSAIGANDGRRFAFQKTSAANDLIFDPQGSDRVNGSASNYLLSENSEVVILVAHNDDDAVLDYDNWIATIQSQTVAGTGLTKSGSSLSLNLAQDQSWTGSQRSTPVANTSGSFDMATGNNFNYTPSGNQALTFTNITAGQGGILYVVNSGHTITKHASVKVDANLLATVTAAGTYMLGYYAPTAAIIVVTNSLAVT